MAETSGNTRTALHTIIRHAPDSRFAGTLEHAKNTEWFISCIDAFNYQEMEIEQDRLARIEAERKRQIESVQAMRKYYRPGNPRHRTLMHMR